MKNILLLGFLLFSFICFSQEEPQQESVTQDAEEQESEKKSKKWNDRKGPNYNNNWCFGLGINSVNNSGEGYEGLMDISNWNFGRPLYLSVEYYLSNRFSIEGTLSLNSFQEGSEFDDSTILRGWDANYVAADLAIKYSLGDLLNFKSLEPYLFVGAGNSHIGSYKTEQDPLGEIKSVNIFTFNAGIGANYWFSSAWGINLNATGKWASASENSNHSQVSFGAVYSLN